MNASSFTLLCFAPGSRSDSWWKQSTMPWVIVMAAWRQRVLEEALALSFVTLTKSPVSW